MQSLMREPVRTFSIGYPVPAYDETKYAREVAERLHTNHREFRVEPSAMEILPQLVRQFDEPFGDSSAVPTWYLSKLAREHVTVALAGDGGDELFAGYDRYRAVALGARIDRGPAAVRHALASRIWQRLPTRSHERGKGARLKRLLGPIAEPPSRRYLRWISIFDEAGRAELYTDAFLAKLPDADPFEFLDRAWKQVGGRDDVTRASFCDVLTYLPGDLLTKVDMASMAHGLECREPFVDHRVVELAAAMPVEYKLRHGRGKRILVETFRDLLPASVQHRKKMGFGVPIAAWFRGELRELTHDVLLDSRAQERGYFRPSAVRRLLDEHQSGKADHAHRLWALLVLELWHREWLDGK
jgi:asparagine synthase (glutamine-hydrolysing)